MNWQQKGKAWTCLDCGLTKSLKVHHVCCPCPHLGPPIPNDLVIIKSLCPSCGGKHKWKQTTNQVHECAEKGRCLPTYRCAKTAIAEETVSGDASAQPCVSCELRPGYIFDAGPSR